MQILKGLREQVRDCQPVFHQIAQTRWGLRALRHNPPVTVWPTGQVKSRYMQVRAPNGFDPVHSPQVARVTLHQRRRNKPLRQQALRAIHVSNDLVEQAHALRNTRFDVLPAFWRDDQWK